MFITDQTPYWSAVLHKHGSTKTETVAQFRKRLDILDVAPTFTPFGNSGTRPETSLTKYEQDVESFLTPAQFKFISYYHGPSSKDFGTTLKDESGKEIHILYPLDYSDEKHPYVLCEDQGEEIYLSDKDWLKFPITLERLELHLVRLKQEFERKYTLARLLSPTHNQDDGFFFFH